MEVSPAARPDIRPATGGVALAGFLQDLGRAGDLPDSRAASGSDSRGRVGSPALDPEADGADAGTTRGASSGLLRTMVRWPSASLHQLAEVWRSVAAAGDQGGQIAAGPAFDVVADSRVAMRAVAGARKRGRLRSATTASRSRDRLGGRAPPRRRSRRRS